MSTESTTADDESETESTESESTDARVLGYKIEKLDQDEREQADEDGREPEWEHATGVYNYRRNAEDRADELESKRENTEYRAVEVTDE